jgi:hypothetical protein
MDDALGKLKQLDLILAGPADCPLVEDIELLCEPFLTTFDGLLFDGGNFWEDESVVNDILCIDKHLLIFLRREDVAELSFNSGGTVRIKLGVWEVGGLVLKVSQRWSEAFLRSPLALERLSKGNRLQKSLNQSKIFPWDQNCVKVLLMERQICRFRTVKGSKKSRNFSL